jgi:rSAM/selenodomain-associated transferase 2
VTPFGSDALLLKAPRTADRRGDVGVYMMDAEPTRENGGWRVTSATECPAPADEVPAVSVVIPALDEERALPGLMASLRDQQGATPFEILLADGGSTDRTVERFAALMQSWPAPPPMHCVVRCPARGRAAQMNAGARAARGAALLFLHADTLLPRGAIAAVASALVGQDVAAGGFRLRFQEDDRRLAIIAWWATIRSRLTGIHYGDQAMFVRRDLFERLGGFPEVRLFEDLRLSRQLRRKGRTVTLALAVRTSGRRLIEGGIGRTALRFAWLKVRHLLGRDPARLSREYRDVR